MLTGATRRVRFVDGTEVEIIWLGEGKFALRFMNASWNAIVDTTCTFGELLGFVEQVCIFTKEIVE
jgi:hypothetical protein